MCGISQGARDGGAAMHRGVRTDICFSAIVPALPNKLHPCNDVISALSNIVKSQGSGAAMPMDR